MSEKITPFGINRKHKDGHCIVVGCDRVALYRAARATKGGYCRVHKSIAVERTASHSKQKESFDPAKRKGWLS